MSHSVCNPDGGGGPGSKSKINSFGVAQLLLNEIRSAPRSHWGGAPPADICHHPSRQPPPFLGRSKGDVMTIYDHKLTDIPTLMTEILDRSYPPS